MGMKIYWQGLFALIIALALFLGSPYALMFLDPTAGTFDLGYLQRPVLALVFFLFATFAAWLALQLDWPDVDRWVDDEFAPDLEDGAPWQVKRETGLGPDWLRLSPLARVLILLGLFALLLTAYLVCLALVPV